VLWSMAGLPRRLLEEFFVSQVLADSDVSVFSAELQDLVQKRVVAFLELSFEAHSSGLHPDLKHSIAAEKLIETELFAGIFFEDVPVLNNVYHACVTLNYVAA
jgi:hypothetical protein